MLIFIPITNLYLQRTPRKLGAFVTDLRLVAVRERNNEVVSVCHPCRGLDLILSCVRVTVLDVAGNGCGKQRRFLPNVPYQAAKMLDVDIFQIHSVKFDAAVERIVETFNKSDCSRLPASATWYVMLGDTIRADMIDLQTVLPNPSLPWTDQCNRLTSRNLQRKI